MGLHGTPPVRGTAALGLALAILTLVPMFGPLVDLVSDEGWEREIELASRVETEGDPASDEEVQARVQAGGETVTLVLQRTPAGLLDGLPGAQQARDASPTGPVDAELRLEVGPVVLEGPGNVSPSFPLRAHASLAEDHDIDEAWLRLDGERWAELEAAGEADGRPVLLGQLGPGSLPADRTTHADVVFERYLAPEATQIVQGPGWDVYADARGPPAPSLVAEETSVRVEGEGARFEVQTRPAEGAWRSASLDGRTVASVDSSHDQVRARGIDEVGNAGPWSPPLGLPTHDEPEPEEGEDFELLAPRDGDRVEGLVHIDWRPAEASPLVEAYARRGPTMEWQEIGQAMEPPIAWRTSFVPDGTWQLHVRAETEEGWSSRLVTVHVDNLDEETLAGEPSSSEEDTLGHELVPRTHSPLSAALASGAGLLALAGLLGQVWKRRPK